MTFEGLAYRAINPVYARRPLSGEGAARHGGRFNARGVATLYLALSPQTAIREANQVGTLQSTTLVAYRARIGRILDVRQADLRAYDLTLDALGDPGWWDAMRLHGEAPTQAFARTLSSEGWAGLLVPSYARGAGPKDVNLVLWRWGTDDAALDVVDDEDRLGGSPLTPPASG